MVNKKNINTLELAKNIANIASETKAVDISIIDLQENSSLADYIVIASARSQKQVQGVAHNITDKLADIGFKTYSMEGYLLGEWVLIDYGDVIVHIFFDEVRTHYDFDSLWKNHKQMKFDEATGDLVL